MCAQLNSHKLRFRLIMPDGQIKQVDQFFMAHDEAESAEDTIVFERAQRITVILAQAEHL